jgi:hypothetical protein
MINAALAQYLTNKQFVVLRRKKDGMPLNVSYTEDGLKWTSNKLGRSLYYKKAKIQFGKIVHYGEEHDTSISPDVYVELFVPKEHKRTDMQTAELRWVDKALRLCY